MRPLLGTLLCMYSILLMLATSGAEAQSKRFKAGFILPMSGPLAGMGEAFRRGVELAKQDGIANEIEILFEDSRYDGKTTVSALHKLRESDQVTLVAVWGNTPSGTAAPIANTLKLPMIGVSMNPDARGRKFVMTFGPSVESGVTAMAAQINEWKLKTPAAVSADLGNALAFIELLRKVLTSSLVVKTFANEESDFKTIISMLRKDVTDGVVLFSVPEQAITFLKQAKQMQFFPKIIGGDVFADDAFRSEASKYSSDISFLYGDVDEVFPLRIKERFGNSSYFFEAACGYTTTKLISELLKASPSLEVDPFATLANLKLTQLPIPTPVFSHDPLRGYHLETKMRLYPLLHPELTKN